MKVWWNYMFSVWESEAVTFFGTVYHWLNFADLRSYFALSVFAVIIPQIFSNKSQAFIYGWKNLTQICNLSLLLLIIYHPRSNENGEMIYVCEGSTVIFSNYTCDSSSPTFLLLFFPLYILLCEVFPLHAYVVFDRTFIARCHAKWLGWSAYDIN